MVLWILPRCPRLRLRGSHPLWPAFPGPFGWLLQSLAQSEPRRARTPVWAPPVPLAATPGITVVFSSSGYLDVSVRRVPSSMPMCSAWGGGVFPRRVSPFRHPRIHGYVPLPAAFRSLSRLSSAPGAKASALCPSSLNRLPLPRRLAWRLRRSSRTSRPAPLDTGSARRTHGRASPRLPAVFLSRCPMGSPPPFGSLHCQYSVFKVQLAAPAADGLGWARTTPPPARRRACAPGRPLRAPESCLSCSAHVFERCSGGHLLSHARGVVPSAACGLTIVFGMGTGMTPRRIATGTSRACLDRRTAMRPLLFLP